MAYEIELPESDFLAIADSLHNPGEVHLGYEGRGMYGKSCPGIVMGSDLMELGAVIAAHLTEWEEDEGERSEKLDLAIKIARNARTDSMGYSTIVYFPNLVLV